MCWEGTNVVLTGRKMMGETKPFDSLPGTIRGDYCIEIGRNIIHGSDSVESAKKERPSLSTPSLVPSVETTVLKLEEISSNFNTVVSTDGTREGVERLGLSHHLASSKDNIGTLPAHGNNRGASHVLDQTTEERFVGKVSIVLLQMSFSTLHHL